MIVFGEEGGRHQCDGRIYLILKRGVREVRQVRLKVGELLVTVRVRHFVVTLDWIVAVCGLSFDVFFIYVWIKVLRTVAEMKRLGWGWTGQGGDKCREVVILMKIYSAFVTCFASY